jgi:hypothetical protein
MDRSHHAASDRAGAGPPIGTLVMAACVPFAVMGLLALPLAFDVVKHLVGF